RDRHRGEDPAARRARPLLHRELVGVVRPLRSGKDTSGAGQVRERLLMAMTAHVPAKWTPVRRQGLAPLKMTATQPIADAGPSTGKRLSAEKLRSVLLWLMGFAGAFVFVEPSPYEVVGVLAIIFFAITGLAFRAALMPLVMILVALNIGYA